MGQLNTGNFIHVTNPMYAIYGIVNDNSMAFNDISVGNSHEQVTTCTEESSDLNHEKKRRRAGDGHKVLHENVGHVNSNEDVHGSSILQSNAQNHFYQQALVPKPAGSHEYHELELPRPG